MATDKKKILSYLIKFAVLVLAAVFIYKKLSNNQNLRDFADLIKGLDITKVRISLFGVLLLMFLNWFIESIKWEYIIRKVEKISLWRSIESVFCGLTWAVFTPNRIGEYGGRVFFLPNTKRIKGVVAMSVGHIAQMVLTNIFGAIAILWFINTFQKLDVWVFIVIAFIALVYCSFFVVFYFNIHWLNSLIGGVGFLKKFRRFSEILETYTRYELCLIIFYSILRFAVFTSQYLLVIKLLVPEIAIYQCILLVFILFFVQSALPSLDLLDFGVRGMTAAYFFGFITNQEIAIMSAAALIWFVNLMIPAVIGSFFVFKLKFFGNNY
ncbi:hypothetical protein Pedsa_2726 [Pseudopedobacter saltans DSM 12145]|uniref:Lysylphosphatidylglycerol synthetase/UPF0104 n=1 Tax=Pseudopedobacter saltans (strain ATCC 51119 / DSM 12145 / JCM 21818 / CCUG 39354 / LMG 10337 / NBRC 100064 / NCIMB 13643) TaxID=762903 RepID=F0S705_PSESL|nr:lysylphosphatidylglycerol synthase domain-containing protein [Pseudopedobacter saltans]ADY53268.1 hypothetical protein Pedsa_2726 [Pseudopedobacter saltans DSM 12145]